MSRIEEIRKWLKEVENDAPTQWNADIGYLLSLLDEAKNMLKRAHACATLRDDGSCDGCPVSKLLEKMEGGDERKET